MYISTSSVYLVRCFLHLVIVNSCKNIVMALALMVFEYSLKALLEGSVGAGVVVNTRNHQPFVSNHSPSYSMAKV